MSRNPRTLPQQTGSSDSRRSEKTVTALFLSIGFEESEKRRLIDHAYAALFSTPLFDKLENKEITGLRLSFVQQFNEGCS